MRCKICRIKFDAKYFLQKTCINPPCLAEWVKRDRDAKQKKSDAVRKLAVKPLPKWLSEAQAAVNRYVRARDAKHGCISCGKGSLWSGQWHCSHYYSRGHSSALRFNLLNMHKSCSVCNGHLSGNIGEYTPRLIKKIGQVNFDRLESRKSDKASYSVEYLARLKKIFNKRARFYER